MEQRGTAERVRPILEAMERSIVEARNRRTGATHPARPERSFDAPDSACGIGEDKPVRLKARPKRGPQSR